MAGEDNDLSGVRFREPRQRSFKPIVVIQHKAVVEDQRQPVDVVLDEFGGGQAQSQVDLVGCAAADLLQRCLLYTSIRLARQQQLLLGVCKPVRV